MEELQVKVTNLRDIYTVEYDYPDFHLSMECYYCSLADEADEPQKHDRQLDIRWIPRTSLATVEWMPADKGLIDALIELKEDRLETNSTAKDAKAATTVKPAPKPKRAPKRRSKKRPKPGLLDGIDTSDLSATAVFGTAAPSAIRASPSAMLSFGRQSFVATSSATALPWQHSLKWAGHP